MRYICHLKPTRTPRHSTVWLTLLAGVSLLAISVATPVRAQNDQFVVDVSDPSVSVDLSVLNDGGIGPQMGAMAPGAMPSSGSMSYGGAQTTSGAQAPGPNLPVSTLYVQPSTGFTLPPQTKAMIAQPAPEPAPEMDVAEDTLEPTAPEEPVVEEALAEDTPPAPLIEPTAPTSEMVETEAAPPPTSVAEQAPEPVAEQAPEPVAEPVAEPIKEVAAVEPEPAPALAPAPDTAPLSAVTQEPTAEAVAPDTAVEATPATEQTPPPPPQALSQPAANAPADMGEKEEAMPQDATSAPASPSSVVVDLPPKLEEMQPGVASLPPSTGPLSDGDNMRIVFENDSSKLPSDAREALKTLSARMNQQDGLRLQLLAYAGGTDTSASAARRLSLSRALAVRSYLIENGVRSTRIDVRALGNKSTEAVTERVDITIVER